MTKSKLVVLVGSFAAVAFLGYEASSGLATIGTLPMNVSHYRTPGDVVNANGSWKKVGGNLDAQYGELIQWPNTVQIRCDINAGECKEDGARVTDWSGSRYLILFPVEYRIISWEDGILLAQQLNSSGAETTAYDVTLRISVKDKAVTRTSHGKRTNFSGRDSDLSGEWLEEVLK